jgi:hypothetical protein
MIKSGAEEQCVVKYIALYLEWVLLSGWNKVVEIWG